MMNDVSKIIYPKRMQSGLFSYPHDFLMTLLRDITACLDREEVFTKLPNLLPHSCGGRVSLWRPPQNEFAELNATSRVVYSKTVSSENTEHPCKEVMTPSKIILPLLEDGDMIAVLKLERTASFDATDYQHLLCFTQGVSGHLTTLAAQQKARVVTQLTQHLLNVSTASGGAEHVLEVLANVLGLEQGAVLTQHGGHFQLLASCGQPVTSLLAGLAVTTPWLRTVYEQGQPLYSDDLHLSKVRTVLGEAASYVIYPLGETQPVRFILVLAGSHDKHWLKTDKELLAAVCCVLSMTLQSAESQSRLQTLLTLQHHSLATSETGLLQEILLAALKTVPGAEGGSLMLRQGKRFYFRAAVGYDFGTLESFSFRDAEMHHWQQPERLEWNSSEPRIFSKNDAEQNRILGGATLSPAFREVGRVDEIQSNLYFPIVYQGQVLAVLNLDNFHDANAFAADSIEAARMFGPPVAALLRERRYRYLLERDSLTDPLTNLANRRAFDQALTRESGRAQSYDAPFSLLMLDLGNFKTINDTLGHAQGDAVLVEVAKTLRKVVRPSDLLFRWGGDEFAVLLLNTAYDGAVVAARRCARAIKRISKNEVKVNVHIGVASYPSCTPSTTTLVQLADERLYEAKEKDITVFLTDSFLQEHSLTS